MRRGGLRSEKGSPAESERARTQLARIGARAIAPLLDALGDADPAQQRVALDILGYLGNPNATRTNNHSAKEASNKS